jgi:Ran GTPase-activating protein (RanGAP) involved in mRNA processing and transport
MTPLGCEFIS